MERLNYTADFATLKAAYLEVKNFLEKKEWGDVSSLSIRIENDLGFTGDDTDELLIEFTDKYNLKYDNFDFSAHFHSEDELFGSIAALGALALLPLRIIKIITFGKINLLPPKGYWDREILDLTFGDMVAWYLAKDFKHRSEMNIMLAH